MRETKQVEQETKKKTQNNCSVTSNETAEMGSMDDVPCNAPVRPVMCQCGPGPTPIAIQTSIQPGSPGGGREAIKTTGGDSVAKQISCLKTAIPKAAKWTRQQQQQRHVTTNV